MDNFLKQIAYNIVKDHKNNLDNLCIVFPNRRAGLFFQQYLALELNETSWLPNITTISDFFKLNSSIQISDELSLIIDLYKIFTNESGLETEIQETPSTDNKAEDINKFYPWGQLLLRDFDEIDKYLIDASKLYKIISDEKEIESYFEYLTEEQINTIQKFWGTFKNKTKHEKLFIEIWHILNNVYQKFNKYLIEHDVGYEGVIYKDVVNKLKTNSKLNVTFDKIIFVGFNALNKCEEFVFDYYNKNNLAEFYWDTDDYYIKNDENEAGFFLRNYINKYKSKNEIINNSVANKNINVYAIPQNYGMVKVLGNLLKTNISENEIDTAIVLPDEHLLLPTLNSLPNTIEKINITMGYPIKNTSIYMLIENVIQLQQRISKDSKEVCFYYKDVLKIIQNEFVYFNNISDCQQITREIKKNNIIRVSQNKINSENNLFNIVFKKVEDINTLPEYILNILHFVYNNIINNDKLKKQSIPEKEHIYHLYKLIKNFKAIIDDKKIEIDINLFLKLYKNLTSTSKIPFSGEPLEGLQVMGVLETRCLDFENLYILSMNEGVFPNSNIGSSFIPYNLRKAFYLPVFEHHDAIFAYHFYRLIQRAKNIYLIYNTQDDSSGKSEMSRFIYQLKYDDNIKINEFTVKNNIVISSKNEIRIKKDRYINDKLFEFTKEEKGFSPTAINKYLSCKLKFYFSYIARISQQDEVIETIDSREIGNIFHKSLELLYNDSFVNNKVITKDDIKLIEKNVKSVLKKVFQELLNINISEENELIGNNLLLLNVIENYIKKVLKLDKEYAPFKIIGLESKQKGIEIPFETNNSKYTIKLSGSIDRIDIKDNTIRIIDYKTGNPEDKIPYISALFDKNIKFKNSLQIMLYSLMYYGNNKEIKENITPTLFYVKKITSNDEMDIILEKNKVNNIQLYEEKLIDNLKTVISDIFNHDVDFTQTEESKNCEYCEYKSICGVVSSL